MPRINLPPEGYALVVTILGVALAYWLAAELVRRNRARRELHRRAEEGQRVRQQVADVIESCNVEALRIRRIH